MRWLWSLEGIIKYFDLCYLLEMEALYGGDWEGKVEKIAYHNSSPLRKESQRGTDDRQTFEESLAGKFHITNIQNEKLNKSFTFDVTIDHQPLQVELFIYEFCNMKGSVMAKKPVFIYKISSIYKVPLSQKQFTNWVFHSCFNTLQAQNLYISIDYAQNGDKGKLVIQMSQYESDIMNALCGQKRLATAYWKPSIVEKIDVAEQIKVDLFDFVQKMAQEAANVRKICNYPDKKELSRKIFDLLSNPLNFLNLKDLQSTRRNICQYFLEKPKATILAKDQDLEIQYSHLQRSGKASLSITIYFYDFGESKFIFDTQSLFLSFQRLAVFKKPLMQAQRTSLLFKQLFLVLYCTGYVISVEFNADEQVYIQIAKEEKSVLERFRGQERFQSKYWSCIQQSNAKLRQNRVYSFEKLMKVIEENFEKSSIFGAWKAVNNTTLNVYNSIQK